jgi:polar amino acid transport system substrate-binding protein
MKKYITRVMMLLLALAMMLSCTACGSSSSQSKDRLEQIKEKGYIEMCTEPYFAPFEYIDPSKTGDDQYQGMDIEVAKYIADKLGVELKITALDFTAVLTGVTDGKYDMAISAIAYSPARAEAMALSNVYYSNGTGYGFIVRTEDLDKYNSIESLADAVVITQSGSVQEGLYNQYINGACKEFKLVANMTDGYLAVAEGKADVCICSTASAGLYAEANGGMAIPDFRFEVDPNMDGECVAMPLEGTESLVAFVNECLAELNENGQIEQWYEEAEAAAAELGIQ